MTGHSGPFAERQRDGFPSFAPGEQFPGRYDELKGDNMHDVRTGEYWSDWHGIEAALKEVDQPPLTIEAIAQNPWRAVAHDLPENASPELAAAVVRTTDDLGERATAWANILVGEPEEREHWLDVAEQAQVRGENAALAHDLETARAAWREPAFSRATIEADPWTAAHLAIPENADPELLAYARDWARDLGRYAEGSGALAEPLVNDAGNFTREQNMAAAAERAGVLDGRLWLASERMEERHRAEWELYGGYELPSELEQRQAGERERLDALIGGTEREAVPAPEHSRAHGEFLSSEFIARRASEHLARTVDLLLGAVIGYFVPEPELTPEQARLAALSDAERGEAMEFEMARRQNAAALAAVNTEIDRHRPHVKPEEPARPDSIYERYPGLTRDIDDDARERDRAFYDTGIERGR